MAKLQGAGSSLLFKMIAAFAAVYLIWGSTYLAIRIALETMPPYLMAGVRFLLAGALLYAWTRSRGAPGPTRSQWAGAAIVGALLLLLGNGSVVWAEQKVPSGMAALLIATEPLWIVILDWARRGGVRPTAGVVGGLALGFVGVGLLVLNPDATASIDPLGAVVLIFASCAWAAGSLYSRTAPAPAAPLLATGMQMLTGGAFLVVAGLLTGEAGRVNLATISDRSWLAFGYLVVFGSLVAFSAYVWLLRVASASRVSTYAYVNPVIAVFLGWALASEPLTSRTILAATIIVAAVALIVVMQSRQSAPSPVPAAAVGEPVRAGSNARS